MTSVTSRQETITPQRAQQYLQLLSQPNRRLVEHVVSRYANDMKLGRFVMNGEPIIFDSEGAVIDGQHRLHACVRSGTAFTSMVVRGVPHSVFVSINTGRTRIGCDVLSIAGYVNSPCLAGAARFAWQSQRNGFNGLTGGIGGKHIPTNEDTLATVSALPGLAGAAAEMYGSLRPAAKYIGSPALATFLHCSWSAAYGEDVSACFFGRLGDGDELTKTSPILLLRNRLIAGKMGATRLRKEVVAALVIKAFHLYRTGAKVSTLRLGADEKFPSITTDETGGTEQA